MPSKSASKKVAAAKSKVAASKKGSVAKTPVNKSEVKSSDPIANAESRVQVLKAQKQQLVESNKQKLAALRSSHMSKSSSERKAGSSKFKTQIAKMKVSHETAVKTMQSRITKAQKAFKDAKVKAKVAKQKHNKVEKKAALKAKLAAMTPAQRAVLRKRLLRQERKAVLAGKLKQTRSGMTAKDLFQTKSGSIVSAKKSDAAFKRAWMSAVEAARTLLGFRERKVGFVPVGGSSEAGSQLYFTTRLAYEVIMKKEAGASWKLSALSKDAESRLASLTKSGKVMSSLSAAQAKQVLDIRASTLKK